MRRVSLLAGMIALVASLVSANPAVAAPRDLRPGDYMVNGLGSGASSCTLGFAFAGTGTRAGQVFLSTAAHCVKLGQTVYDIDDNPIGKAVFVGSAKETATDYAFIRVSDPSRVHADVKGHPSYPTGVTTSGQTLFGDELQLSGYGVGFHVTATTRENRGGFLEADDATTYVAATAGINGDSGGPVVHIYSGRALGLISRLCVGPCTDEGPTIQGILAAAAKRGFGVTLMRAA